jgi:hypothetical protein
MANLYRSVKNALKQRHSRSSWGDRTTGESRSPPVLRGEVSHSDSQDMKLLDLEGELALLHHLREQLESLEHLKICV